MNNLAIEKLLDSNGLLARAIAVKDCPKNIEQQLINAGIADPTRGKLAVIANAGARFWQSLEQHASLNTSKHPVDDFSLWLAQQMISLMDSKPPSMPYKLLYPSGPTISLMALGKLLGWTHPSPLGMALHHNYGPWFAYRFVFYFESNIPSKFQTLANKNSISPCLSCVERFGMETPCVSACPGQAVSNASLFDIARCSEYQNAQHSRCAKKCLARNACPVGLAFRYSPTQQAHHMSFAVAGIKRWLEKNQ